MCVKVCLCMFVYVCVCLCVFVCVCVSQGLQLHIEKREEECGCEAGDDRYEVSCGGVGVWEWLDSEEG